MEYTIPHWIGCPLGFPNQRLLFVTVSVLLHTQLIHIVRNPAIQLQLKSFPWASKLAGMMHLLAFIRYGPILHVCMQYIIGIIHSS